MRQLAMRSALVLSALAFMVGCSAPDVSGSYVDNTKTRFNFSETVDNKGTIDFKLGGLFPNTLDYTQDGKTITIIVEDGEDLIYEVDGEGNLVSDDDVLKRINKK